MRISDWSSDVCSSDLVDDREIVCGISSRDLRDRGELVFDQTDPREVARRRRAVDLAAVGRHHRLVGPGRRLCDEDSGGDEARTSEAAEMALDAREEHRSEEHTSELQSLMRISYAVFCLKQKNNKHIHNQQHNTT